MDYVLVVTFVTCGQGICPKERRKVEGASRTASVATCVGIGRGGKVSQLDDVEGITIEDTGVIKRKDKWSFVRGGVFVVVGGVTNSTMCRTPLPFFG